MKLLIEGKSIEFTHYVKWPIQKGAFFRRDVTDYGAWICEDCGARLNFGTGEITGTDRCLRRIRINPETLELFETS